MPLPPVAANAKMGCLLGYVLLLLVRCPLCTHHPLACNPGGGDGHAMVPGYGCNDKQITVGEKQLIIAYVAHLVVRGAGLHYDGYSGNSIRKGERWQ